MQRKIKSCVAKRGSERPTLKVDENLRDLAPGKRGGVSDRGEKIVRKGKKSTEVLHPRTRW